MSRDIPCSERVRPNWEGRLEDFQRFYDAAACRGVFDEDDIDFDDADLGYNVEFDPEFPWLLSDPCGEEIDRYKTEAEAYEGRKAYRIEKGLDPETGERPDRERVMDEFNEYGLSFDYVAPYTFGSGQDRGYWRYQLSWGGPSDEIRFYGDYISRYYCAMSYAEYWYMDWFDGASIRVRGEVVNFIWDQFKETGTAGHTYEEAMKDYEPPMDPDFEESSND